jgi:hypothetical protein
METEFPWLQKMSVCNNVGDHVLGLPDPDPLVRGMDPDLAPDPALDPSLFQ